MNNQPQIKVTVFDNSQDEKCQGRCGIDFSSLGTAESVAEHLKKLYGEAVRLEYLDLADPSVSSSHPETAEMIVAQNLLLPLLLINDKLRIPTKLHQQIL